MRGRPLTQRVKGPQAGSARTGWRADAAIAGIRRRVADKTFSQVPAISGGVLPRLRSKGDGGPDTNPSRRQGHPSDSRPWVNPREDLQANHTFYHDGRRESSPALDTLCRGPASDVTRGQR